MQDITTFIQSHSALSLAFAVLVALLALVEFIRHKRSAQQVTPIQLTQMINHQHAVVVDIRPTDIFAKGHVIGSQSLPMAELKNNHKKIEKLKTKPIVLVCAKGLDSPKIAATLKTQGYDVHVLGGGINSWISANMPTVKE